MEWIDAGVTWFGAVVTALLPAGLLQDLLVNGIIAGVGSVIIFLPNILILFFCIAVFEDTGYLARAAFIMDRVMHVIGLHGKSFIPLLMGFGCNAPAIMATRTLESERDRLLSILINPLISCSARLPVYILLAGTFFGASAGNVIFSIYGLGIALAIAMGKLFSVTLFRGDIAPFVMELPPYRAPTVKSLLIHMWDRSQIFLRKMSGVILVGSILVWVLSSFPRSPDLPRGEALKRGATSATQERVLTVAESQQPASPSTLEGSPKNADLNSEMVRLESSFLGRLGHLIQPIFAPLGFDWRTSVAVLTGFVAKEIVVSTLGVLYAAAPILAGLRYDSSRGVHPHGFRTYLHSMFGYGGGDSARDQFLEVDRVQHWLFPSPGMDGLLSDLSRREDCGVRVTGITNSGHRVGGAALRASRLEAKRNETKKGGDRARKTERSIKKISTETKIFYLLDSDSYMFSYGNERLSSQKDVRDHSLLL
jgi:ferrous iron transporter FeoB